MFQNEQQYTTPVYYQYPVRPTYYPDWNYGGNRQTGNMEQIQPQQVNQSYQYGTTPQTGQSTYNATSAPQMSTINGKMVENVEMVKVMEVPIGSYGVFPKTDMSEVYIKTWNANGTTNTTVYRPVIIPQQTSEEVEYNSSTTNDSSIDVLNRLNDLDNKIDMLVASIAENGSQKKEALF